MHGGIKAIVGMSAWLLCSLAAIHMGLIAMGYNIFMTNFMQMNMQSLIVPIHYLVGIAGIVSLGMFVMACMGGCGCNGGSCGCK